MKQGKYSILKFSKSNLFFRYYSIHPTSHCSMMLRAMISVPCWGSGTLSGTVCHFSKEHDILQYYNFIIIITKKNCYLYCVQSGADS